VREVRGWKDSRLDVYILRGERYARVEASTVFPDLDVRQLVSFLDYPTAMQAVKACRGTLRAK
jgi:hypothetical protein